MPNITEKLENIIEILGIYRGVSPIGELICQKRRSDCFVYVLSGTGIYYFGNKKMTANPGNIIYLARNSQYKKIVTDKNFAHIHIDFNFENSDKKQFDNYIYKHDILKNLEGTFIKMHTLRLFGTLSDKADCMSLIYEVYSKLINSSIQSYLSESQRKSMEYAVSIIKERLSDPKLTVSDLSSRLNMSEVHFRRLFSKIHKTSPIRFITSLRIAYAGELLKGTSKGIEAISEECGFTSGYYFSRVFKNETGMSPSNYRKIMREV